MRARKHKIYGLILIIILIISILSSIGIINNYKNKFNKSISNNDSFYFNFPFITQKDLDAGVYLGFIYQKKIGTPNSWIHIGGNSLGAIWFDPNQISDSTPASSIVCETCPAITQEELDNGWYYGQLNQKRPGTPHTWLHKDEGSKSAMWFDPNSEFIQGYIYNRLILRLNYPLSFVFLFTKSLKKINAGEKI